MFGRYCSGVNTANAIISVVLVSAVFYVPDTETASAASAFAGKVGQATTARAKIARLIVSDLVMRFAPGTVVVCVTNAFASTTAAISANTAKSVR